MKAASRELDFGSVLILSSGGVLHSYPTQTLISSADDLSVAGGCFTTTEGSSKYPPTYLKCSPL